jgi:hypothetical protein
MGNDGEKFRQIIHLLLPRLAGAISKEETNADAIPIFAAR